MSEKSRIPRRGFFRAAFGELLKPLEGKAAPLQRALDEFSRISGTASGAPVPSLPTAESSSAKPPLIRAPAGRTAARRGAPPVAHWIRPPGALPEAQFKAACTQCADCIVACPVQAIRLETASRGDDRPFIDPDVQPCVLCDGQPCMPACPTGALVIQPVAEIDMGTAEWNSATCVRARHEECTACLDQCPVGSNAIQLQDGRIKVIATGCTGCGVCQNACPTSPKSIVVTPAAAMSEGS